ncbi:MAG: hypothetical protein ACRD43_08135, partial [Pyrinomonadaceae bacterium]
VASIVHFAPMPVSSYTEGLPRYLSFLMMILIAILGILMVSTIRYTSFKSVGSGRRNLYLFLLIAAAGMAVWLYSRYVLLIISGAYVSHGVIWYFVSLLRPRGVAAAREVED